MSLVHIGREYEISCGHHLPLHNGKCKRPHGHNYLIEVTVQGDTQTEGPATGMVEDFSKLDVDVKVVLDELDHENLNGLPQFAEGGDYHPPTAENICRWIFNRLMTPYTIYSASVPGEVQLRRVRVYETKRSFAEIERTWL